MKQLVCVAGSDTNLSRQVKRLHKIHEKYMLLTPTDQHGGPFSLHLPNIL